jgi:hypothetical protein
LPAIGRVLLGGLSVGLSQAFMLLAPQLPALRELGSGSAVLAGLLFVAVFYVEHSGVASIQIGLMSALGYRLPERYNYPFLANNPADFWKRWNAWLGDWCRLYLFRPLALWLGRRTRAGAVAAALGALLSFLVIGALHDLAALGALDRAGAPITVLFAQLGIVLIGWEVVARGLRRLALCRRVPARARGWLSLLAMAALNLWLARAAMEAFG